MAKAKAQKGNGGTGQNHIRARIAFLYKASTYLQSASVSKYSTKGAANRHTQAQAHIQEQHKEPVSQSLLNNTVTNNSNINNSTTNSPVVHPDLENTGESKEPQPTQHVPASKLSRQLASQMRGVSLKSQLRLPRDIKRSICKRCDSLLIPNSTCVEQVENASRGGSKEKPWADVRVVRCNSCGYIKRYPQTEKRSLKLVERKRWSKEAGDGQSVTTQPSATDLPAVDVAR
ncbi:ribonuclease P protein subunit RPR2 [[Emmonsia] crescens]|uniref:Ribonuclease P protein subunit RPR2 n=1 Tax=[Emmonsia] crescens TaxID=73230 RepID=A0A2B7ZQB0_9EURO|nr:ribonuclease P protein subunit RPR2 [Emmonsia crescens]